MDSLDAARAAHAGRRRSSPQALSAPVHEHPQCAEQLLSIRARVGVLPLRSAVFPGPVTWPWAWMCLARSAITRNGEERQEPQD